MIFDHDGDGVFPAELVKLRLGVQFSVYGIWGSSRLGRKYERNVGGIPRSHRIFGGKNRGYRLCFGIALEYDEIIHRNPAGPCDDRAGQTCVQDFSSWREC